ncbi:sulfatase-like hydrolase/transferase [Candidatus Dependentiae bacterium]|nr:sulfatase-like hydrolase/transferase [Candidatus Dependentiae bacterium]
MLDKIILYFKENYIIYIYSVIPIFFLYSMNIYEVSFFQIVRSVIITAAAVFILNILISSFLNIKSEKQTVIFIILIIAFFSFGHIENILFEYFEGTYFMEKVPLIWTLLVILICFLTGFFCNTKSIFVVKKIMVNTGIFLFFIILYNITAKTLVWTEHKENYSYLNNIKSYSRKISEKTYKPNIFFIILDAYPREDILNKIFNYDNSDIIEYLKSKGFYCAPKSMSNYQSTHLSMRSMFGMQIVRDWNELRDQNIFNEEYTMKYILRSKTIEFLKSIGYTYAAFSPNIGMGDWTVADYIIKTNIKFSLNYFEYILMNNTMMSLVWKFKDGFKMCRRKNLNQLSDLASHKMFKIPQPFFLYAHISAPHPPFVFDENGDWIELNRNWIDGEGIIGKLINQEEYRKLFVNEVKYINKQLIKIVENLFGMKDKPVIIIMGDHGSRSITDRNDPYFAKEKVYNFFSVYLPEKKTAEIFYENVTAVNVFPLIFNAYFDAGFSMLQDKSYFYYSDITQKDFSKYVILE